MAGRAQVAELTTLAHTFGRAAANKKRRLLEALATAPLGKRQLRELGEAVEVIRAYPDDARVLAAARALVDRLPEPDNVYRFSYGVLLRLVQLTPGRLEIDWDEVEDETPVLELLEAVLLPGEAGITEAQEVTLEAWLHQSKVTPTQTDLELLVDLTARADLPGPVKVALFERCDLPVRYVGRRPAAITLPVPRLCYQRSAIDRSRFPIVPHLRKPLGRPRRGGQAIIDQCLRALCPRDLEIYPLIYPNPQDVTLHDCGRGVGVILIGVAPAWRSLLECLYFYLVTKNGAPVAYGPASVFAGCCEMGMNLFPTFRGAEVRFIYAQLMRVLHQRLGVGHFFLTPYAMGVDNEEALVSGAFWFYRKLGFSPTNPAVEALACAEEARMVAEPGYRCDRHTLRRLSNTAAYLDLSRGRCRPIDQGALCMVQSELIAKRFAGDRRVAEQRCAARAERILGVSKRHTALRRLGPLLAAIPGLAGWPRRDLASLAAFVRAKEAGSEQRAARLSVRADRFAAALRDLGAVDAGG